VADALQETIDYVAITRLHSAYADIVNRRAWAEFTGIFLPDAPVRVDMVSKPAIDLVGPIDVGTFIGTAIERFEFFEFVVLNLHVEIDDDTATSRLFMCELRQERDSGRFTRAFGLYRDDCRRVDGAWRFARRRYQSLARSGRGEVFAYPEEA
jgi:hypothetical protein